MAGRGYPVGAMPTAPPISVEQQATATGRRRSPFRWVAAAALVACALAGLVAVLGWQWGRNLDGVLAGVEVDGTEVAGLGHADLVATVDALADERGERVVRIEGGRDEVEATRAEAGARVDRGSTVARAWQRGRRGVFASFVDHLRAAAGATVVVDLVEVVDEVAVASFAADTAERTSVPPRDGGVELIDDESVDDASRVVVTEPAVGEVVDADDLGERLDSALNESDGAVHVEAPGERTEPQITEADVAAVADEARRAVSAPVVLRHPGGGPDVTLTPADIAAVLAVDADREAPQGERLELVADPEGLGPDAEERLSTEPTEARFVVQGDDVRIQGGQPGVRVSAEAVAEQVLDVATRAGHREEEMVGQVVQPDLTRDEAERLGVREPVSSFTTEHACCQPRVHNIQLMADVVDGVVLRPGERFSLNEHVGRRTRAKGFRADGVIVDGEVVDQVGGGVSQFATTFFNAAFFAGIELVEHQPHSFYIPRYPAGRESTLNYGTIDVVVRNDSPHGILVTTSYTGTSITVTFYSTPWAEVEARASERRNVRPGEVRDGFDITVERHITYPSGQTTTETYVTRYEPNDEGA